MANIPLLRLRVILRRYRIVFVLIALTLSLLLFDLVPVDYKAGSKHLITARTDSTGDLYARFQFPASRQRINGLYDLWQNLTLLDTVIDRIQTPFQQLGNSHYVSKAMLHNPDMPKKISQLGGKNFYLLGILSASNLIAKNDIRFSMEGTLSNAEHTGEMRNFYWALQPSVSVFMYAGGFFDSDFLGSESIQLAGVKSDSILSIKIAVGEEGLEHLIDRNDKNVGMDVIAYPINLRAYLTSQQVNSFATVYPYASEDSTYTVLRDSTGADFGYPLKQVIIPGNKRYTAAIIHYDDLDTKSILTCASIDSADVQPGIYHPEVPVIVAAMNQRQTLVFNSLTPSPGIKARFSVVAATSNRYEDLKNLVFWFVHNEMTNVKNRGVPLSEIKMRRLTSWMTEQFGFTLTKSDSVYIEKYFLSIH